MKNQTPTLHRMTIVTQFLALGWTALVLLKLLLQDIRSSWGQFSLSMEVFGQAGLSLLAFVALLGLMTWPFWFLLLFIRNLGRDSKEDKFGMYWTLVWCAVYIIVASVNAYALMVKGQRLDELEWCTIHCAAAAVLGMVYLLRVKVDDQ